MTRNKLASTTFAIICAVIVVLAVAVMSVHGAVPPPSKDAIAAAPPQAVEDSENLQLPETESGTSPLPRGTRIVQIKKSWKESWSVGDDQDPPDGSGNMEDRDRGPTDGRRHRSGPPKAVNFDDDSGHERLSPPPRRLDAPSPQPNQRKGEDRPEKGERGPWVEINLLLKSFDDLVEFYEEQGRWADKEQALRQRIEICRKLAELRMLAEADGPGAAMQEFYRSIHRPDRALELDLHNLGRELDRLAQKGAELDAEMARLAARRDLLERKMSELNERRDQRLSELSDMQKRLRMEQADPDDADDEDEDVGDTWYGPERDLSKPLDAVEAALTDRGMEDSSRERLEWRRGRILRTMQRDAVDPQVPVRKAAQADPNSAASGDSTSGLGEAALLNMLEPPCRPDPDGESYAKQRVERNFAEIESRLQPVEAPLDQTVASGIMGPPDDRD